MRKDITVAAEVRTSRGKNEARRTRAAGNIPAVVYGAYQDPVSVAVNPKELSKIIRSSTGLNTIFNLAIAGGETTPVMVVDRQVDPDQGHAAARRPEAHRSRPSASASPSRCITEGEPDGREGAGRTARNHLPLRRNRVPAGRDSGELHGQRDRTDDRPEQARQRRGRHRLHEAGERSADRDRAHRGAARRRSRRAGGRRRPGCRSTAAEPEVVKKGKKEEEAAEKEKGKKK